MDRLFDVCAHLEDPYQIARAYWMFEKIHPFSDGNGRVGRMVMYKELLRVDALPVIIHDSLHDRYVANMDKFPEEPGLLVELLLFERDIYQKKILEPIGDQLSYTYNDHWDEYGHDDDLREDIEFKQAVESKARKHDGLSEDDNLLWGHERLPWPGPSTPDDGLHHRMAPPEL